MAKIICRTGITAPTPLATVLLSTLPGRAAEIWDVLKSSNIDAMFAKTQGSLDVLVKPNYAVTFRVNSGKRGTWQIHHVADEYWFVRRGSAKVWLGEFTGETRVLPPGPPHDVAAGDVVKVPGDRAYQIAPGPGRFEYVAVQVFPKGPPAPSGENPMEMPVVVTSAQIDATFAQAATGTPLDSSGAALLRQDLYWPKNPAGPYEVDVACDELYFKRMGTAKMELDGSLVRPQEGPPGEIHGEGVTGSRAYTVGPGDIVSMPRNTVRRMDSGSGKLGSILVKVCD